MAKVNVGPNIKNPTHHIGLVDADGLEIGIIAINTRMEPAEGVIGRNPVERSSLKTTTGSQSYSDMKPPYAAIAQTDWSGGRGNEIHETDSTKFSDALRLATDRSGRVILAGRETYGTGNRLEHSNLPGNMRLIPLIANRRALKKTVLRDY